MKGGEPGFESFGAAGFRQRKTRPIQVYKFRVSPEIVKAVKNRRTFLYYIF